MSQPMLFTMILGGAPDANWIPVLLLLIALLLMVRGGAWFVHYLKRRIRERAGSR